MPIYRESAARRSDTGCMGITLQYGSEASSPEVAAEHLRATAEMNGIRTRVATRVDLIASAYAAEQWCLALRTRTLEFAGVHGEPAVMSLAAVLSRASGRRRGSGAEAPSLPRDDAWEALAGELPLAKQWDVANRVVGDLTYGGAPVLLDWVKLRLGTTTAEALGTDAAS